MSLKLSGPKLKASPSMDWSSFNLIASFKYPLIGSKTCCHGLVESGERKEGDRGEDNEGGMSVEDLQRGFI